MKLIHSVTGKIKTSELGQTLIHEHLKISSEEVEVQFPHLYDEESDFIKVVSQVNEAKERGIKTICDPTVQGLGRDIRFMEKVAKETGVQIIAATGIYTNHYLSRYFQLRSIDHMANLFVRDIEIGIQNTSIKAGFLKCATDVQGVTPDVEKVIRAVARAHHKTGSPIMTHSHPDSGTGLLQLDILEEEGVDPKHILIGHCGDTDNIDYLLKVLDRGAFIGMDRYGLEHTLETDRRNATVADLVKRGFASQMFLSQDYPCSQYWLPSEMIQKLSKWSLTYIMDVIIPELKKLGVTDEHIHTMMFDNARRWFEGLD